MILLALALAVAAPPAMTSDADAPRGPRLAGAQLEARTNDVGALLRCPVCQGLSVTDSPATMARNMKAEIREKLKAGYDQEQILASFERSYGEFVRLEPPARGVNWLVWLGPVAVLLAGGAVIAWSMRRRQGAAASAPAAAEIADLPSRDALPDDAQLAAAVKRVGTLAYGWTDGLSPSSQDPR